ncbi:MAG: hypothetical protein SCI25_00170 [Desulfuromonadales bacterium]|nr:hypothetical protein [Desulfuromonadales bacterium]
MIDVICPTCTIWIKRLLIAIPVLCLLCLTGCASPEIRIVPEGRIIQPLPNGNYEVTPGWLRDRYEYEAWLTEMLDHCQED